MRLYRLNLLMVCALAVNARSLPAQQTQAQPPWRSHLMPWLTHTGQPRPWRTDARLAKFVERGYPDDVLVLFANPDSGDTSRTRTMWVTVTVYDSASGLFLGILGEKPQTAIDVAEGDNVVFRIHPEIRAPVAVAFNGSFRDAGWPPTAVPGFFAALREGIRAYRLGHNGHNMPEIERCISILTDAMEKVPPGARQDEQFVGHYVLGRCLAEKYLTEQAMREFRSAIALDTNDLDSHMALLAELSVMTHHRPGELAASDETRWEREFLVELAIVRQRFGHDPGVEQLLTMVFDPAGEAGVDSIWRSNLPKLRRVGYFIFRWKER